MKLFRRGDFDLRTTNPGRDAALVHQWLTHPKAAFWMMRHAGVDEVVLYLSEADAYIGSHLGVPSFLVERYDPKKNPVGRCYDVQPGDVGMHFLVAPADAPIHGFTRGVIGTVMAFLFTDPSTRRVVVEPDVRNTAVHTLNAGVGFQIRATVALPDKTAYLSTCTRHEFLGADT